jgi:hypothetical protein
MQEAFRLGGWGMYPTLFFGSVLVIAAGAYALNPRRRLSVVLALGVLTFLVSCLGFVTGVIKTLTSVEGDVLGATGGMHVAIGIGESLVNVGFGLVLVVLAGIGVVVGMSRNRNASTRSAADLIDPHGA